MTRTAQHSAATPQHGTPPALIDLAHATMGGIDVDPASSPEWNQHVRATRVITAAENGLRTAWFAGAPRPLDLRTDRREPGGAEVLAIAQDAEAEGRHAEAAAIRAQAGKPRRVFLNPPGDPKGRLVAAFWWALAEYFARRWCTSAVWVGFNVEQLARLQRVGARSHPLQHVTLVPAERFGYRPSPSAKQLAEDPPHASFVTLLTRSPREIETFATLGGRLGHVINAERR